METTSPIVIGSRVRVISGGYPGTWVVVSKLRTNYRLQNEQTGTFLRCPPLMLETISATDVEPSNVVVPEQARRPEGLTIGSLVRIIDKPGQLFTVIKDSYDKVNVAVIGGDNGRYYRGVPTALVTIVAPADVLR